MGRPFTDLLLEYLLHRVEAGRARSTVWGLDYVYNVLWGEWMHKRGICEPPNRNRMREYMPPKQSPSIRLCGYDDEMKILRFFYGMRDAPSHGRNWRKQRRYRSAWMLLVVVRGLGCRPPEARGLTWGSVEDDFSKVKFFDSKTNKDRVVPVVLAWVRDALAEERARTVALPDSPVCKNTHGGPFVNEGNLSTMIRAIIDDHPECPGLKLKEAQKLQIAQMIRLGFPPHVVAKWSDHTLTVQERHYYVDHSYLPPEKTQDYDEFGVLSEYGMRVREHLGTFSKDISV
jgi:integrase